jgi:hypothetical protein
VGLGANFTLFDAEKNNLFIIGNPSTQALRTGLSQSHSYSQRASGMVLPADVLISGNRQVLVLSQDNSFLQNVCITTLCPSILHLPSLLLILLFSNGSCTNQRIKIWLLETTFSGAKMDCLLFGRAQLSLARPLKGTTTRKTFSLLSSFCFVVLVFLFFLRPYSLSLH